MPETLFIIGREPELSVAELEAVVPGWGAEVIDVQPAGVLLRTNETLPPDTIDRLGGSLKQVEVLECFDLKKKLSDVLPEFCTPTWLGDLFAGRVEFGVSGYGLTAKERGELHHYFLGLKKEIHDAGRGRPAS